MEIALFVFYRLLSLGFLSWAGAGLRHLPAALADTGPEEKGTKVPSKKDAEKARSWAIFVRTR